MQMASNIRLLELKIGNVWHLAQIQTTIQQKLVFIKAGFYF